MERLAIDHVDRIRLAGAFGSHIDVKYAMVLGMIPDCPLDKVSSAGNAAGTGARIALLDQRTRTTVETLVRRIEKIETAVAPRFQEFFVEAMAIPHLTAPYPALARHGDAARGQGGEGGCRPAGPACGETAHGRTACAAACAPRMASRRTTSAPRRTRETPTQRSE